MIIISVTIRTNYKPFPDFATHTVQESNEAQKCGKFGVRVNPGKWGGPKVVWHEKKKDTKLTR